MEIFIISWKDPTRKYKCNYNKLHGLEVNIFYINITMQTFNNNLTKKYDTILEGFKKACGDGN